VQPKAPGPTRHAAVLAGDVAVCALGAFKRRYPDVRSATPPAAYPTTASTVATSAVERYEPQA
jgi:hypothetical protein